MRRLYDGRVRPVRLPGSLKDELATRTAALTAAAGAPPPLDDVARSVIASASADGLTQAIRSALQDIVAREQETLRIKESETGFAGGLKARRQAKALSHFKRNADAALSSWQRDLKRLVDLITGVLDLPKASGKTIRVAVPMIALVRDPARLIAEIIALALGWSPDDAGGIRLGGAIATVIKTNLLQVSGLSEDEARARPQRLVWPDGTKASGSELVERYLGSTPLADLLLREVEIGLEDRDLFEHMWIMAKSGHGKTQALAKIIVELLERPDRPAIILLDSQGELIERVGRLRRFAPGGSHDGKLVLLDPREMERPIALNLFAQRRARLAQYTPVMREQLTNGVIELIEFVFGSVLGAELTQKQGVIFRYLARLLMAIPGANIGTLREALETPERFANDMARLEGSARQFFERQFFSKEFTPTRSQILRRLWGILEQPTFERMLSTAENKLDLFDCLQDGRVVLVDTAMDFLKKERSQILGRVLIAMTLQAVFERAALPRGQRRPAFLIIDEAHEVVDENIGRFLVQARKFNCGVIMTNQLLGQLPHGLRQALAGQTAVKLIGRVSDHDAKEMAADAGTTAATLLDLTKRESSSDFILNVANKTARGVKVTVPFFKLDRAPQMTEAEWRQVRAAIRTRYGAPPVALPAPPPLPATTAPPTRPVPSVDEDDWRS